jgi:hypothetical protein
MPPIRAARTITETFFSPPANELAYQIKFRKRVLFQEPVVVARVGKVGAQLQHEAVQVAAGLGVVPAHMTS